MKTTIKGIEISSPDKIIFPKCKITKLDVVKYYEKIAPIMLQHIQNRPLSVIRCHKNISETFFKKHPNFKTPHTKTFTRDGEEYFYIDSIEGIIEQAQLGTLEFHTSGCFVQDLEKPNLMVFDLDPDEDLEIKNLRQGVLHLKEILDELKLPSHLKTSGGKGYHIVVPFSKGKSWKEFTDFSKNVALLLEAKHPTLYTTNIRKKERKNKIFIDYLRNDAHSTCVCPYSLRARENAPISMPIKWSELNKIAPNQITIKQKIKTILNYGQPQK